MVMLKTDQLIKNVLFQFATDPTEVGMLELAKKLLPKSKIFKLKSNGFQLLSNLPDHSQFALEPTDLMELTALEPSAMEQTDHSMDHPVLHALEKSQLLFHTTTPSQPPDNHTKLLETSPQPTHLLLTHQPQSLLPLFKKIQLQPPLLQLLVPTKLPPLTLERISTKMDTHNQKKFSSLTQKLLELTPLSSLKKMRRTLNH